MWKVKMESQQNQCRDSRPYVKSTIPYLIEECSWAAHLRVLTWVCSWINHLSVTHGRYDARPTVTFAAVAITFLWPLPNFSAWLTETCVNNLPNIVTRQRESNPRPLRCKSNAVTTGLHKIRIIIETIYSGLRKSNLAMHLKQSLGIRLPK